MDYVLNPLAAKQLDENPAYFKKEVQDLLCGGRFYNIDFPEHPRQLEKRRQGWGLRIKRTRSPDTGSDDADMDMVGDSEIDGGAETPPAVELGGIAPAWKRKRVQ